MNEVLILGAGLSGLSASYHLNKSGIKNKIIEKEDRVGGLCRTEKQDGFKFDYTGHYLHFKDEKIKKLVQELTNNCLVSHTRRSAIYLYGKTTPYPFQINTYGHSAEVIKECITGMIEAKFQSDDRPIKSFEDWILKTCGKGVAKHFMFPYNSKIWTVHPKEMTTHWMSSYVPVPDIEKALDGALTPPSETIGYNAQFLYPKEGGIEALPNGFASHLKSGQIELNSTVERIIPARKVAVINGKELPYQYLISSLPLKSILNLIEGADDKIVELGKKLRNTSVCNINLGVNRESLSNNHWLYFPEDKYCFYRAGFPSQLSPDMAPAHMSSVNVEISYTADKPLNTQNLRERVIEELIEANILRRDDEIVTTKILNVPCAYVIYDHNREEILADILKYLEGLNIASIGRYGNWEYSAMEDAILHGIKSAEKVLCLNKAA